MAVEKIFCHDCRNKLIIKKSEGRVYIYIICESKNPGKKELILEKTMLVRLYNPDRCPICNKKCIQDTK